MNSQNHRMVGVVRDLCGSSSPTPLPNQGHLQQAAQDLVQAGLEYLQSRRLHNLPEQPVPGLRHPQSENSYLQDKFLLFHLVTACANRFLLVSAAARSGREQRGVFISSSVASSRVRNKRIEIMGMVG